MKTIFLIILITFYVSESYTQGLEEQIFLMRMEITETDSLYSKKYEDYVFWGMNNETTICFLMDSVQKELCFYKMSSRYRKRYSKQIKEKLKVFETVKNSDNKQSTTTKLNSIFRDSKGGLFHIHIYWKDGILIWITRVDGKFPCYFFQMTTQ